MSDERWTDRPSTRPLAMSWLAHGLPLTLLLDLADPEGPDSEAILRAEQTWARPRPLAVPHPRGGWRHPGWPVPAPRLGE